MNDKNAIELLAGIVKTAIDQRQQPVAVATRIMNVVQEDRTAELKERFMSKAEAFLLSNLNKLSADDRKRLLEGSLRTMDATIYVARKVDGWSGINKMFETQDKAVGVTNIDKGKIPEGENYTIDRIALGFDTTGTSVTDAGYTNDQFDEITLNSDLEIWSGSQLVFSAPIAKLITGADATLATNLPVYKLEKPIEFYAGNTIEIKIETPSGEIISNGADAFLKAIMMGVKTSIR